MNDMLVPTIENHGIYATHNMPCAVCRQRKAVLDCNTWIFQPCWECRCNGYATVKLSRWAMFLRNYFS